MMPRRTPKPASDSETVIASPDSDDARHALDRYRRYGRHDGRVDPLNLSLAMFGGAIALMMGGALTILFIVIATLWTVAHTTMFVIGMRSRNRYQQHIDAGTIIAIDAHLIHVWDELCVEYGVIVGPADRHREIGELVQAATDLEPELARRAQHPGELDMPTEARIRARLLHDVQRLKLMQQSQHEMDLLAANTVTPSWGTDDEIADQLRILRKRHGLPPTSAPGGDASGAPAEPRNDGTSST